ncbi:hypothetical protein [Mucilaginibacter gilvus]|uniref:TonB C-terminal domain-containing protein n=1 Tax=Mucilaginibacter gilvus TaxID=2305909 RepID=A0A444MP29_9SPHI|nr:hypothetical protein [Mucilaginibacter gilvus]RWY52376.1 hypothetical protein EPL05_10730 [Mucilaginibacter gilvus]
MKFILTALFLSFALHCFAQNQDVYFYKKNGDTVSTKDSADFIRIVREPDAGSELYNVLDYYPSGKRKLVGKSSSIYPQRFEGPCMEYFETGKRSLVYNNTKGWKAGDCYRYYPNGVLYMHIEYPTEQFSYNLLKDAYIKQIYDSTGVVKFTDGNGYYTLYNDAFTEINDEGAFKNSKREGSWKGIDEYTKVAFKEEYKNGELISAMATKNGKTCTYPGKREVPPEYPGGGAAFLKYLSRHFKYPAEERNKKIQGKVILTFYVEEDGKLSDICL